MKGQKISRVPRVSVAMPVFNAGNFVESALTSIQHQEFTDFELIVVDDGSSDETPDVLRRFAAQEPRMRLIRRPNRGLIATRNQLLDEARGELIAWMDADDRSHPDRLVKLVAKFDSDPSLVCVGSNAQIIDPIGEPLGVEIYPHDDENIRSEQMSGGGFRFPSTMQRRSIATKVGGFREPFRMGEDLDFLLRVGERGRMANVPECLYFYRYHADSICHTEGLNWPAYRNLILSLARERHERGSDKLQRGEELVVPEPAPADARELKSLQLLGWASAALSNGDRGRAFHFLVGAIRAAPSSKLVWLSVAKLLPSFI